VSPARHVSFVAFLFCIFPYLRHPIIKKLNKLRESDKDLAQLIAKQLFANAMVGAGLAEDPRMLLTNMNTLLSRALEKY